MAHRFTHDMAYGCLTHYRFRHPDTGEWVQTTSVQVAQVEQVFRYCGIPWRIQSVACDQCAQSSDVLQETPPHMPEIQARHSAA
jgi:hypothetical protein